MSRCLKDKKVTGDRQQGFTKDIFCLTNVTAFYNEITEPAEKGRAADVVYFDFSKAFDAITRRPPLTALERYELG